MFTVDCAWVVPAVNEVRRKCWAIFEMRRLCINLSDKVLLWGINCGEFCKTISVSHLGLVSNWRATCVLQHLCMHVNDFDALHQIHFHPDAVAFVKPVAWDFLQIHACTQFDGCHWCHHHRFWSWNVCTKLWVPPNERPGEKQGLPGWVEVIWVFRTSCAGVLGHCIPAGHNLLLSLIQLGSYY